MTTTRTNRTGTRNIWNVEFLRDGNVVRSQDVRSNKSDAVANAWNAWATFDSDAVTWADGQ
jgi:hypothetical protein